MPRAFDRQGLPISNDPNQGLEFHPQSVLQQAAGMWQTIIDAILEAAENLIKEFIQRLVGLIVNPEQALDELWTALTSWTANVPILGDLVEAITGVAGGLAELGEWASSLWEQVVSAINDNAGINLASWDDFIASLSDGKGIDLPFFGTVIDALSNIFGGLDFGDLPTPEDVWAAVVSLFIAPLDIFSIPADVQASINGALGNLQDALDGSYSGSGPIFLAVQELAKAWLTATSPLKAKNLTGTIPSWLLGPLSAASLVSNKVNLLANAEFEGAVSVDGGGVWHWEAVEGRTDPGSAWTTADGTLKVLASNPIGVSPGQKIVAADGTSAPSVWVKTSGYAGSGTPLRFMVREYLAGAVVNDRVLAQRGGSDGVWSKLSAAYTVPTGVDQIRFRLVVDSGATAGGVGFDDGDAWLGGNGPFDGILGMFNLDSLEDLFGLNVPSQWTTVITDLLNPLDALEDSAARSLAGALDSALDELTTIFDGSPLENPVAAIAEKVKGWWDTFFNGGPKTVVTQNQVATPSGIPPLDSEEKMPWTYLPTELMGVALGMPWARAPKSGSNQSITASTDTLLTSWGTQSGPISLTFTSNKFTLPLDGMWYLEIFVKWSSATVTAPLSINLKQNDVQIYEDISYGTGINKFSFPYPAATTDVFGLYAKTTVSSMSVTTADTYIRATWMGQTTVPSLPPPNPPVAFGAAGGSAHGSGSISWSHTFTADDTAVVVPISHEGPVTPVVTISGGGGTVPVLSGPTYIGNYFGANARSSFAAALLPPGVAGTTRTITVTFGSGGDSAAASANSLSFKGVVSLGVVKVNSGSSAPNISVPSNVSSMVVCQFAGMDVNFSSFNRTQTNIWNFIAFDTWSHVMGYAVGGSNFTATGGKWAGKAIELSNH